MDLKDIRYFVAVAEEKSMTRAARSLYMSQPALSLAIKRLETELNMSLFTRDGNALLLTAAGNLLLQEGQKLLAKHGRLLTDLAQFSSVPNQTIRFGISPFYSKYYLPDVFQHYARHFPGIRLSIEECISVELEERVIAGLLDFCFVPALPSRPELVYRTIDIEEIFLAIPKGHLLCASATDALGIPYFDLSGIRNESFILQPPQQKIAKMQSRILQHFGLTPNVAYESMNWDTIYVLTAYGMGLSFLPEILAISPLHKEAPNFYRIAGIDTTRPYAVAHSQGTILSRAQERLIDVFAQSIARRKQLAAQPKQS